MEEICGSPSTPASHVDMNLGVVMRVNNGSLAFDYTMSVRRHLYQLRRDSSSTKDIRHRYLVSSKAIRNTSMS
ncbi:hypothetical protein SESBI_18307 [Sesbania bispinosa]|nr:hypothetical protein SESBI_18307 [Sesbania bispinosa]